ncbi:MAG: hypothetical protein QOJ12_2497 [Thermoleophilales bacterium]|nr:hypothetical protein [Thermoleophilales bacterium]
MARPRRRPLACVLAVGVAGVAVGLTAAAYSGTTTERIDVTANTDWTAPTASPIAIAKSTGGEEGYIKQAGSYRVYANVTDSGNPAAGAGTVTTNASAVTTGQSAAAMTTTGGPFTINGTSYSHRSAALTANTPLTGTPAFSIAAVDVASPVNTMSPASGTVTMDNTAPTPTSIATSNAGGTAGRPVISDTITFTWQANEVIDKYSISANWTGATLNCVVRINNNIAATANNDQLLVYDSANTAVLPLTGANGVNLGTQGYVGANRTFGATGTASSISRSGNAITVTLGTPSAAATTSAAGSMIWNPSATATDRAGSASGTATITAASKAEF